MNEKEVLFFYRLKQAEDTLKDAVKMLNGDFTPRSITNRAYYSVFYAILALFIKADISIKTSKHIGIISIFDKEFVRTQKLDKRYSLILHKLFNVRQKGDYKELIELAMEEAKDYVELAKEFLVGIKDFINKISNKEI